MTPPDPQSSFRHAFVALADIPECEWRHFRAGVSERRYAARDHLIWEGRAAPTMHFIVSGLARYYYSEVGRELVRRFDYEGRFVSA